MEEGDGTVGLGTSYGISSRINNSLNMELSTSSSIPIGSSNIGFQGRLEPVEAYVKKNKRGLGAEKCKKAKEKSKYADKHSDENENENDKPPLKRTTKHMTKKMKKMLELEKRLKEKEFERAFYREFWPDNV